MDARKQWDVSLPLYERVLALLQQSENWLDLIHCKQSQGLCRARLGQLQAAAASFEAALEWAKHTEYPLGTMNALSGLGYVYFKQKNREKARACLEQSLELARLLRSKSVEKTEMQSVISNLSFTDHVLLRQIFLAQHDPAGALWALDRAKESTLLERNGALSAEPAHAGDFVERAIEFARKNQVALLSIAFQNRDVYREEGPALDVWYVDARGLQHWQAPLDGALLTAAAGISSIAFRGAGFSSATVDKDTGLDFLSSTIGQAVAGLLQANPVQRLIVFPDGFTFGFPYAAIRLPDGHYLSDRVEIQMGLSIQWETSRSKPFDRVRLDAPLVIGNPVIPRFYQDRLPPLPGAETEARVVAGLLHTTPLIGAAASKSRVLEQWSGAGILHLATHAWADETPGEALTGALVMSPDEQQPFGVLEASEILSSAFKAELVVLSACSSGLGLVHGEGVMGLAKVFLMAGAHAVVASTGPVNDTTASVFMEAFYRQLVREPAPVKALQHAMQEARARHPDPVDWARFVLLG